MHHSGTGDYFACPGNRGSGCLSVIERLVNATLQSRPIAWIFAKIVIGSLRRAFSSVKCPYADSNFTREYWVDMREWLLNLSQKELQWELPRILEVLSDDPDRENLDQVLWHLDALKIRDDSSYNHHESNYDKESADRDRLFYSKWRERLQLLYATFTREQACAVRKWLEMVRTWYEYRFYEAMVDSAIVYWTGRCESEGGRNPCHDQLSD